jgi:hypothetical protein
MAAEPGAHLRVLVDGIVVENGVDDPTGLDLCLDGVQEADELLMPVYRDACSHPIDSHSLCHAGIPPGTQTLDFDH